MLWWWENIWSQSRCYWFSAKAEFRVKNDSTLLSSLVKMIVCVLNHTVCGMLQSEHWQLRYLDLNREILWSWFILLVPLPYTFWIMLSHTILYLGIPEPVVFGPILVTHIDSNLSKLENVSSAQTAILQSLLGLYHKWSQHESNSHKKWQ